MFWIFWSETDKMNTGFGKALASGNFTSPWVLLREGAHFLKFDTG
jgi:hypothetical protein